MLPNELRAKEFYDVFGQQIFCPKCKSPNCTLVWGHYYCFSCGNKEEITIKLSDTPLNKAETQKEIDRIVRKYPWGDSQELFRAELEYLVDQTITSTRQEMMAIAESIQTDWMDTFTHSKRNNTPSQFWDGGVKALGVLQDKCSQLNELQDRKVQK